MRNSKTRLCIFVGIIFLSSIIHAESLEIFSLKEFLSKSTSKEKNEIVKFLINQFNNKSITTKQLDSLWNNDQVRTKFMLGRFQIINQKLYTSSFTPGWFDIGYYHAGLNYYFKAVDFFSKLVKKYKIPNVDFIIYFRETIPSEDELAKKTLSIPAFVMFQDQNNIFEKDKLLFPDSVFLRPYWRNLLLSIDKASKEYKWEDKENKIFWRGAATGDFIEYNIDNIAKLPRLKISLMSVLYPNLIDAKLVNFNDYQGGDSVYKLKKIVKLLFGKENNQVLEKDHLKYKYLLSLDGNSATGMRVPWIMYSNSVLIKQESSKIEWFYSALKPYQHYIPIDNNLENIFKQIQWIKDNPSKVKEIIFNGHNFVKNNLKPEDIEAHVLILLDAYEAIQKDKNIQPTLPEVSDWLLVKNAMKIQLERIKNFFYGRFKSWF